LRGPLEFEKKSPRAMFGGSTTFHSTKSRVQNLRDCGKHAGRARKSANRKAVGSVVVKYRWGGKYPTKKLPGQEGRGVADVAK